MTIFSILFFSALIGGGAVFTMGQIKGNALKLTLAFSGSYLLAISVLHLIPEIYQSDHNELVGPFILLGFFLQILLEYFSGGLEHGHAHNHGGANNTLPLAIIISLCVHAFTEGIPLGPAMASSESLSFGNPLLLGIAIHKMPVAFVLTSFLLASCKSRITAASILLLFAFMAPLGAGVHHIWDGLHDHMHMVLAIVIGIFLHVSTTILFESSDNHRFNLYKIIIIIFGAGLAFLN